MKPKVIFFVIPQLRFGGGEKQFYLLLKYLDRRIFEPHVISLEKGGELLEPIRDLRISVHELSGSKVENIKTMLTLFRHAKPDVVHTWLNNEWGRIAAIIYRSENKFLKIIASERDEMASSSRRFKSIFMLLGRFLSYYSDAVTFNSPKAELAFIRGFFKEGVSVFIGNGVESSEICEFISTPSERLRLIMVARLVSQKNHDFFLRALAKYTHRDKLEVLLVGDGPLERPIAALIDNLGIGQSVKMLGKRADVSELLRSADVGVLLSVSEGFSNAVLEYIANGLAIIVTDAGANAQCVDNNGYVIASEDDLHRSLDFFLNCTENLTKAKHASLQVAKRFMICEVVSKYQALYLTA